MSESAIKVDHVTKVYKLYNKPKDRLKESLGLTKKKLSRDHYALRDISFDVKKGETVGIIGTNGSGKSTILKIITGVLNPTSGNVQVDGRISALLELGAGFNMEYTGIENVYLNGTMIGFSKEEIDAKLQDILSFADIGDFVYQPVKTYSSGMFVRLAFAIAINVDPEILIVDEALSVGDVFFQAKCFRKINEIKERGTTILLVTHDMGSIIKYCDRVVLLNKGNFVGCGEAGAMVDLYKKILANQFDEQEEKETKTEGKRPISVSSVWKKELNINPACTPYGDGRAEIIDFAIVDHKKLISNLVMKGKPFEIKMKVQFNSRIENPIFAFTIKDKKGTELTGTNTLIEDCNTKITEPGMVYTVTFSQNMSLQGGEYLLSFGCTGFEQGEFVIYHRLYDVTQITVLSDKNTVGLYDIDSKVELTVN